MLQSGSERMRKLSGHSILQRIGRADITLPEPAIPVGSYKPYVIFDRFIHVSGQFPLVAPGQLKYSGAVGRELTPAQAHDAARQAALNVLAHLKVATSSFDHFDSLIRVEGHVAASDPGVNVPEILDGASLLFSDLLGLRGDHARSAFIHSMLPLDAPVELVVTAALKPAS